MNDPIIEMLSCVTDTRREQAKSYGLANILLFESSVSCAGRSPT